MRLVGSNFITAGNEHELSLTMSIFMTVTLCWKSKKCFITSTCICAFLCDHSKLENHFKKKKKGMQSYNVKKYISKNVKWLWRKNSA